MEIWIENDGTMWDLFLTSPELLVVHDASPAQSSGELKPG
jgi:hypothetical protein